MRLLVALVLISGLQLSGIGALDDSDWAEEPLEITGDGPGPVIITEVSEVVETPVFEYNGVPLYYHVFRGYRVVDPSFYLSWETAPTVHYAPDIEKYRVIFPIELKYDFDLPPASGDIKWVNMEPTTIEVNIVDSCGSLCSGLEAKIQKSPSGKYFLVFYCGSSSHCTRTAQYFIDSNPIASQLFSFLEFTFVGTVDGTDYTLKKRPSPSAPVRPGTPVGPAKPACPPAGGVTSDGLFRFEPNRILLYAIQNKIGQSVYHTFLNRGNNAIPPDRSLPRLYRSDALDNLAATISGTGYTKIVAEMRTGGVMVAQVVFDVSNTAGIDKQSWFAAHRVVSSHPFWIGTSGFNYFSVHGDPSWHRRFFINYVYPGCPNDHGFWVVLDGSDACPWGRAHWTGAAPLLIYNARGRGVSYQNGNAVGVADRFLVYLRKD